MKKVAIIGAGQVAEKVHAHYYQQQKEAQLVAVVDPNLQRAEEFCTENGVGKAYKEIDVMFEQEQPDIVNVCTPNRFHFQAVMTALENGAAVFCEKPPAISVKEAKQMYEKAVEKDVILAYDFQHRFSQEAQFLKKQIGTLGEIYFAEAIALRRSGVPGWGSFTNKELQGGGPLIDIGIHMLDTTMYLLGFPKVKKVTAHTFKKLGNKRDSGSFGKWNPQEYSVEDALFGVIELTDKRLIRIDTSFILNIKEEKKLTVKLYGTEAGANLYPAEIYRDVAGKLELLDSQEGSQEENHYRCLDHFFKHILGDSTKEIADGWQGFYIQKIISALYQSAESGESVLL